jgi:hypothetical protein
VSKVTLKSTSNKALTDDFSTTKMPLLNDALKKINAYEASKAGRKLNQ